VERVRDISKIQKRNKGELPINRPKLEELGEEGFQQGREGCSSWWEGGNRGVQARSFLGV